LVENDRERSPNTNNLLANLEILSCKGNPSEKAAEAARAAELNRVIEAGPPPGSSIPREAWRTWHEYGFVACPRLKTTCVDQVCGLGASCVAMRAIGLAGDGAPLKWKLRPRCGAKKDRGRRAPFA